MRPSLAVSAFVIIYSSCSDALGEKVWLQPECEENVIKGFNEARFVAGWMRDEINKGGDRPKFNQGMKDWFNFDTSNQGYKDKVVERYNNIASLERTNDRVAADLLIYCDLQLSWVWQWQDDIPEELKTPGPDKWAKDDDWDHEIYKHKDVNTYIDGKSLGCRREPFSILAQTFWSKSVRNNEDLERDGILSPAIIDLCNRIQIAEVTTSEFARYNLAGPKEPSVSQSYVIAFTIIHELIHVPFIGSGEVDGVTFTSPPDDFDHVSGYLAVQPPSSNSDLSYPGPRLVDAWKTVNNPDSYAFFALTTRMRLKCWDTEIVESKNGQAYEGAKRLRWVWNPTAEGADDSKWVKKESAMEWIGDEWRTDQGPNWTNGRTP